MSLILVTGQPGSGKTALVVDMIAHDEQFKGRPLFVMGIPELTVEHQPCPPVEQWTEMRQSPEDASIQLAYFTFPPNAVIVVDEAQRVYRPRSVGSKVPPEVAAFETHRHTGVDFILLTQHVGLIDSNIRKLIGRHIAIRVTPLGRFRYEWTEIGDPESSSSRSIAVKENYKPPKRAFALYKSSQLHTKIKVKLPWYVYLFAACLVGFAALGWYAYQRVVVKTLPDQQVKPLDDKRETSDKPAPNSETVTTSEYLQTLVPRIPGLHHTASRYDKLTEATEAPWPSICVDVAKTQNHPARCRCLDQQGNNYAITHDLCRHIAYNGLFKDFGRASEQKPDNSPTGRPTTPPAAVGGPVALASAE